MPLESVHNIRSTFALRDPEDPHSTDITMTIEVVETPEAPDGVEYRWSVAAPNVIADGVAPSHPEAIKAASDLYDAVRSLKAPIARMAVSMQPRVNTAIGGDCLVCRASRQTCRHTGEEIRTRILRIIG